LAKVQGQVEIDPHCSLSQPITSIWVTTIHLEVNGTVVISHLSAMTNLRHLGLARNNINDVSALAGMTNLFKLRLNGNNVSDISALATIDVRSLHLHNNNISEISPLLHIPNIGILLLRGNPLNCPAYNTYIPELEANNPGIYISYDPMPPECMNQPPVAHAGEDQRVAVGDIVCLDGSGSYDPDGDALTYSWSFDSIPPGSGAIIAQPTEVQAFLMPDLVGDYVVSLVVNDGTVDSDPDTVTIAAISPDEAAIETLIYAQEVISELPEGSLKNKNSGKALINKIDATLGMIAEGSYEDALSKLEHDILKKTDGCDETGAPDKNDWILMCEDQADVYPLVTRAIELLQRLVN